MYGDSQALYSSDDLSIFPLPSDAKQDSSPKNRELFMDSAGNQTSSGLLRFRSAPSSFFESFSDGIGESVKNRGENQGLTSRFSSAEAHGDGYSVNSQLPLQYPTSSTSSTQLESVSVNGGFRMPNSTGMDHLQGQYKMGSNLMRQNSSPADLFSHLSAQSGYAKMRAVRRYRMGNGGTGTENLSPTSNLSKAAGPMDFSSVGVHSSTLGMLSRISEIENEIGGADDGKLNGDDDLFYGSGLPFGSWHNNPSKFDENFTALKREIDDDHSLFQGGELRNPPNMLSHHLSLPKTSAEITAMEKLFQFSDSVPCKIRAKRGCATHPRSIAERVRRTRISERMRKLQELVPNMDKQTNTAGMLDLAVDYIKDLQKQYKTLSDIRANCKCLAAMKHHPVPDQRI